MSRSGQGLVPVEVLSQIPHLHPLQGDTVVVGELELEWSSDRSEARLFDAWQQDRKAAGKVAQGSARWPHAGGG